MTASGELNVKRGRLLVPVAVVLAAAALYGQSASPPSEYIAFRVDAERVIATVLVRDVNLPQVRKGLSRRLSHGSGINTSSRRTIGAICETTTRPANPG